jgi:dihydroxyacetone kinase-like protein
MKTQKESLIEVIKSISKSLIDAEQMLTDLDSQIGDGDCGIGVRKGFEAVSNVLGELSSMDIPDILKKVGFTLAYTIGGTSGAMLGTCFIEAGKGLKENIEPSLADWAEAMEHALAAVKRRGGNTVVGDKTMIDALEPAVLTIISKIKEKDADIVSVMEKGYESALKGSESTISLQARKGRASYLGERSIGVKDPGSVIIAIIFESVLKYLKSI